MKVVIDYVCLPEDNEVINEVKKKIIKKVLGSVSGNLQPHTKLDRQSML